MEPKRISLKEVKEKMERGEDLFFLDVRGHPDEYKIKGAMVVPPFQAVDQTDKIPRDRVVVAYCAWTNEGTSARVAQKLMEIGYTEVYALQGGYNAWVEAGYPLEKL